MDIRRAPGRRYIRRGIERVDERSWLDDDGHPQYDAARRALPPGGPRQIEFTMTITDPKAYAQPWKSTTMTLSRSSRIS
jgi:hypothetical protein